MKAKSSLALLFGLALTFAACDETTDMIGNSLNTNIDGVAVEAATFNVESRSILADSVLSNSITGYLGKVKDPESGNYITGDFMTQFTCLEGFSFPEKDSVLTVDAEGNNHFGDIKADSCVLRLFYTDFYGDSTQTMKLTAYEMGKSMNEDRNYYSNFSPIENGYIRKGGIQKNKVYSLTDFTVAENVRDTTTYTASIPIRLNEPYTDKDGKTYNNYGTYIMQQYYQHPEYFKNSYEFRENLVPGFYFESKSGLGNMAYIFASELAIYYKLWYADSVNRVSTAFWGTEEVLQTSKISNSKTALQRLVDDNSCTYLKTPAGIFTELTLPVEDIIKGHENDTISTAKVVIQRINNTNSSDYQLAVPKTVLMIPKDSLYSFFEKREIYNNINSYVASWGYSSSSNDNNYTFNNIAGMITTMKNCDRRSANWNKVVLIPVEVTTTTSSSTSSVVTTKVTHNMALTSTKLVRGTATGNSPIQISVIYSKFK